MVGRFKEDTTEIIVSKDNQPKEGIGLDDVVEILDSENGFKFRGKLVRKDSLDLETDEISINSPIGKAIIGKKIGDTITIDTIERITYLITHWIQNN